MARFIDKGNMGFQEARNGEYVDKSGLIRVVNSTLSTEFKFSCISRARRFGKSMAMDEYVDWLRNMLGYLSFDWNKEECYLPNREVADEMERALKKNNWRPVVVIELKYDQTVTTAITQIKQKHYPEKIQDYTGIVLLVGITYNRGTKTHECCIERFAKL